MKRLCATVLTMEVIVIALAIPVATHIDHLSPKDAGLTGGIAAFVALVLALITFLGLRYLLPLKARIGRNGNGPMPSA